MPGPANTPGPLFQVLVTLDGIPIALPAGSERNVAAIRAHLESVVLSRSRLLCTLHVDGVPTDLDNPSSLHRPTRVVAAESIAFDQLHQQLVLLTRERVKLLIERTRNAALIVLINDWEQGRRIWNSLLPELRQALLALCVLPPTGPGAGAELYSNVRLAEFLGRIFADINDVVSQRSPEELSDALEQRVVPWLDLLQLSLEKWNETAPA